MAQPASREAKKSSIYPEPLVIPSLEKHQQTFIILHGRGSNANGFGPALLATSIPEYESLPQAFPHAKFIFPTASIRRAARFNRSEINQWFDNWSLETPSKKQELQIEGLRETNSFVQGLLMQEIELVGARNVVLGGLSQGCAAILISMLFWEGEPLAAVFGMCGWLPFCQDMQVVEEGVWNVDDKDNPFSQDDTPEISLVVQAIDYLREELGVPKNGEELSFQGMPLFLGHGTEDKKVDVSLGRQAGACIRGLGGKVQWREYQSLGHWYSGDMLSDLVNFVQEVMK